MRTIVIVEVSHIGGWDSGIGNRESGIGNRESGIGNRESGIGNRESSCELRGLEVGWRAGSGARAGGGYLLALQAPFLALLRCRALAVRIAALW
ncbi:hypothetical protein XarzCFBP7410_17320 [Xanthomonas arboricola pv. zantedeschiae]|nr:hypothetical protein XarzCFBP7410_17320 [Xanthomonas arboricola pv. zantedeschiae]